MAARKLTPEECVTGFWTRVGLPDANGHRWYRGWHTPEGYGMFHFVDRDMGAHRLAWLLTYHGPLKPRPVFRHICDLPGCCAPEHIYPGTQKDNIQDAKAKGRLATGDRSGPHLHPERMTRGDEQWQRKYPERRLTGDKHWTRRYPTRIKRGAEAWSALNKHRLPCGERVWNARMTDDKVRSIRAELAAGRTCRSLAIEHHVAASTISWIKSGKTWAHVR